MKKFDDFVKRGVVKRRLPNLARAGSLIKEVERRERFLETVLKRIGVCNDNANDIIETCYNIIMELIRARMFKEGFFASGFSAHEAEGLFLEKLGFSKKDVYFVDRLRYFRNGMLYYGKQFDKDYALRVLDFMEKIKERLK